MTSRVESIGAAYAALGLPPGAGLDAAKRSFREAVKALHPDITPPTPETLSQMADIVAAMRFLEHQIPACLEVEISAQDALQGLTRTLRIGERSVILRIEAGSRDGDMLAPVGEPDTTIQLRVRAPEFGAEAQSDEIDLPDLEDFVDQFSRPSANTRFARWVRKSQSAA